ncbi:MAG TPA: fatty acid desaturase [Casimicrobiaceae bacterium]
MFREHPHDARDARRYLRRTVWLTLAVYVLLVTALAGWLPAWGLPLALPLVYVRLSLAVHELMHVRTAAGVSWFHRLAMILDTPLGLGYREHRTIHLRHHRHAATARDPELFQIRGGHARALGFALMSPEYAAWRWVRDHGASPALVREALARACAFACAASVNPAVFLVYWMSLRVCIGAASFVFHHVMHSREGRLGTFALPALPAGTLSLLRMLFGVEPLMIVSEHRAHHRHPNVRARRLASVV